jgi:hypothetical protein
MADFGQLREALRDARAAAAVAEAEAAAARERLARVDAALKALSRVRGGEGQGAARERLLARRREAQAALEKAAAARSRTAAGVLDATRAFAPFTDPREGIGRLDDRIPILMMPVRLETRFGPPRGDGPDLSRELWVRVYPDDCSIDTFEASLTNGEVADARIYWATVWAAAGAEAGERAAWRGLVAGHGSGRSEWIVGQYLPRGSKPLKTAPEDVILAVPAEDGDLSAAEQAALATFWSAMWRADGDRLQALAARSVLAAAVGAERAAALERDFAPVNLAEEPPAPFQRTDVDVGVSFVLFPPEEDVPTQRTGWSRAPRAELLPDRFVFIGRTEGLEPVVVMGGPVPSSLATGPDPYAPPAEQLRPDGDGLFVPEAMRWMTDFEEAVRVGMGIRVPLSGARARRGFDRVLVLGVRLGSGPLQAKAELEALLEHHRLGRSGFGVVPQGTPTNNVDTGPSGLTRVDDPDTSFDALFLGEAGFPLESDPAERRDGQWLAELLGLSPAAFQKVPGANGRDQADARAMNEALWPATLGYWMETMMQPVFDAGVVDATRAFFAAHVSGRGAVPAVRIGRQPYGILPTTALARLGWLRPKQAGPVPGAAAGTAGAPGDAFLLGLLGVLRRMDGDWAALAANVSAVGRGTDPHRTLLDVIGLHPGSAELSHRYAESVEQLWNETLFLDLGAFGGQLLELPFLSPTQALLARLGYAGEGRPEILSRVFRGHHEQLKGPVVQAGRPSDAPLQAATTDGRSYLRWLIDAARTSLGALYAQQGFAGDAPPTALLYLLLRHALQLGYHDGSVRAHVAAGLLTSQGALAARKDATFLHVTEAQPGESRYALLLRPAQAITGSPTTSVADFLAARLGVLEVTRPLARQLDALARLEGASTARLDRAFREHVDLCTYRLDAWLQGFVHLQLERMRGAGGRQGARAGIHLGSYAWLEALRPDPGALQPVRLPGDLAEIFQRPGDPPLQRDPQNQGFIHAPSLNHAVTAAVLRNGYLSDASPENRKTLAVNLTSQRVRTALALLEGIRGGQSLGALLGYQLERGLHDRHALAEVDQFIYDLRKAFPLAGDRMASTRTGPEVPIEAVEARNVVDGLALAQHVQTTGDAHYPFGKDLPAATPAQAAAIDAEVQRLLDAQDAVADVALAEGVHQALLGNVERAAGAADAVSRGALPPQPEIVRTPASGIGLTHRVGLQLEAAADPAVSPVPGVPMTPRAQAEPALDRWLAARLPPLEEVGCLVTFWSAVSGAPETRQVTLRDLALQPIDLVHMGAGDGTQAMGELDDRIVAFAEETFGPRPDVPVQIRYLERTTAPVSVFEALPLLRALRRLVTLARPLRASDLALMNEADEGTDGSPFVDRQRLVLARNALVAARDAVAAVQVVIEPLLADQPARRADVVSGADGWARDLSAALADAALAGVPKAGWGFAQDFRRRTFAAVLARTAERVVRWDARLAEFDALVAAYDALPASAGDEERFALLQQAERRLSTTLTTPIPATPAALRALLPARRAAFVARRDGLDAIRVTTRTSVSALLADVAALLPLDAFDSQPLDYAEEEDQTIRFAEDAVGVCRVVVAELERRLDAAATQVTAHDESGDPAERAAALVAAGKALFGEGFMVIPEFDLAAGQGDELTTALAASASGDLFEYLRTTAQVDFPVDTWLYGAARVREKLRTWEQVLHLSAAFGRAEPELTALQLPALPDDRWLGLQFPPDLPLTVDRLLYTAHFAVPFDPAGRQCGLLLDEWGEVIPGPDVTTGIALHHDRPNQEAPQAMLLVTPTDFREGWRWEDLVDALDETLERARRRAVEPVHLEATPYAQLLPATVVASTVNQLTISTVLAVNNGLTALTAVSTGGAG